MKDKTPQDTKKKLDRPYGDCVPSIRTVYKWFQFFGGHMSPIDAERFCFAVEVITP